MTTLHPTRSTLPVDEPQELAHSDYLGAGPGVRVDLGAEDLAALAAMEAGSARWQETLQQLISERINAALDAVDAQLVAREAKTPSHWQVLERMGYRAGIGDARDAVDAARPRPEH